MNKYIVQIKTVLTSRMEIRAKDKAEAKKIASFYREDNIIKTEIGEAEFLKETKTYEVIK